jgi:hypothetical protein
LVPAGQIRCRHAFTIDRQIDQNFECAIRVDIALPRALRCVKDHAEGMTTCIPASNWVTSHVVEAAPRPAIGVDAVKRIAGHVDADDVLKAATGLCGAVAIFLRAAAEFVKDCERLAFSALWPD